MPRKILILLVVVALLLALSAYTLLSKVAVVEIQSEMWVERVTVTCGSKLTIMFNNSVTGSPVMLVFEVCGDGFQGVGVVTDEATVEYYTSGLIDINSSIRTFKSKVLEYCSSQEVRLVVEGVEISLQGVCVTLKVKPYIGS
jgi:hypothetical protein